MFRALLQALRPVAAPAMRQVAFLFSMLWVVTFVPFAVVAYVLYAPAAFLLVALPRAMYSQLTGRRLDWLERVVPFGREGKMSPDQTKKRGLDDGG